MEYDRGDIFIYFESHWFLFGSNQKENCHRIWKEINISWMQILNIQQGEVKKFGKFQFIYFFL